MRALKCFAERKYCIFNSSLVCVFRRLKRGAENISPARTPPEPKAPEAAGRAQLRCAVCLGLGRDRQASAGDRRSGQHRRRQLPVSLYPMGYLHELIALGMNCTEKIFGLEEEQNLQCCFVCASSSAVPNMKVF